MTLFEQYIVRQGFKNLFKNGTCTGFQFKIRIPYYRGVFISCLNDFSVKADGESFSKDFISLKVGDRVLPWNLVDNAYDIFWNYGDYITVMIEKPGGLKDGLHTIECGLSIRKSYIPRVDPEGVYDFAPIPKSVEGYGVDFMAQTLQVSSRELTLVI